MTQKMARRLINYDAVDAVTMPALIGYTRRLIFSLQKEHKVERYVHLTDDLMWWTNAVSKRAGRGISFAENFNAALEANMSFERALPHKSVYDSFLFEDDTDEDELTEGQRIKRRIFNMFARMAVFGLASDAFSFLRVRIFQASVTRYDAFFDIELHNLGNKLNEAIISSLQAYKLVTHNKSSLSESRLLIMNELLRHFYFRSSKWTETTNFYLKMVKYAGDDDSSAMAKARSASSLGRQLPTREEAIADVIASIFGGIKIVERIKEMNNEAVERYMYDYVLKLMKVAPLSRLFDWLSGRDIHRDIDAWTNHVNINPWHVYKFCAHAIGVVLEMKRGGVDLISAYNRIIDGRINQYNIADTATVYPVPEHYDIADAVRFEFVKGVNFYIKSTDLEAMPHRPDPTLRLGSGSNGAVYRSVNDPNVVVKLTIVYNEYEYNLQKEMGDLGVGPRTYWRTELKDVRTSDSAGRMSRRTVYVIASQLMEKTLEWYLDNSTDVFETQDIIETVLDMLREVTTQHSFVHHDMKPDNVMLVAGGNPMEKSDWKIIDYGFSWYGGSKYTPYAVSASEDCTPYNWNVRTKTKEDPRNMYGGWFRTAPPALIPDWDVFCMIIFIKYFYADYDLSELVHQYIYSKLSEFIEDKEGETFALYDSGDYADEEGAITINVIRDFVSFELNISTMKPKNNLYWKEVTSVVEHVQQQGDATYRIFIPNAYINRHSLAIFNYIGADPEYDNAYACCTASICDATIKLALETADIDLERDQRIAKKAAALGLTGFIVEANSMQAGVIVETDVATRGTRRLYATLTMGVAHSIKEVVSDMLQQANTGAVEQSIINLINRAFLYVRKFEDENILHTDLGVDTLLYDIKEGVFTVRNFADAIDLEEEPDRPIEIADDVVAKAPLKSIMAVRLFLSIYRDLMVGTIRQRDNVLAVALENAMRQSIYQEHIKNYAEVIELQATASGDRIRLRYRFVDASDNRVEVFL
jgi:hypothetical protein